ncbi:MAG: hypothetical protein AAF657_04065 [Acidobacteriota bacterium]
MRLSKSEATPPFAYPIQSGAASSSDSFAEFSHLTSDPPAPAPSSGALADLIDLVANHRSDLLPTLLDIFEATEGAREQATELTDLVAACGVSEEANPCATAITIAVDLDKLIETADRWTHPAQVVKWPKARSLHRLCTWRLERSAGAERRQLEEILPRLERAARLTERAASRRFQEAARQKH